MKIQKKDIKVGNYIALGNKPWFMSAYYRGEDRRTVDDIRLKDISNFKDMLLKPSSKRNLDANTIKRNIKGRTSIFYYKVVSIRHLKTLSRGYNSVFKLKWITDVCENYKEVMQKGGCR